MRREGVTSTDIAAIIGLNPRKSAIKDYYEKIEAEPPIEQTEPMYWGNVLEAEIRKRYTIDQGVKTRANHRTIRSKQHHWMLATPDAFATDGESKWGLECKTAFSAKQVERWGTGGDAMPEEYIVQCAWCMAVCNLARWDVAVLLAGYHGAEFRTYRLTRDRAFEARLMELGREFWFENVLAHKEPDPDGSASAYEALQGLYRDSTGNVRLALSDEAELVADYSMAQVEFEKADAAREVLRQQLMQAIGQDDGIEGEGFRVTWKPNAKGNRVFRATLNL